MKGKRIGEPQIEHGLDTDRDQGKLGAWSHREVCVPRSGGGVRWDSAPRDPDRASLVALMR